MPLYEYDCESCGQAVEILVRGSETVACPHCHETKLVRRLSVPAGHFSSRSSGLPIASGCDPDLPPCSPNCCRLDS